MELPGRISDGPFSLIYPCEAVRGLNPMCMGAWEAAARHPSPLYQAFCEGLLLFFTDVVRFSQTKTLWLYQRIFSRGLRWFSIFYRVLPRTRYAHRICRLQLVEHGPVTVAPHDIRWYCAASMVAK